MNRQRGQFGIIFGVVMVILVLALVGLFAVCTPGDDDDSLGRIQLVSHERDRCGYEYECYDEDEGYRDGGGDQEYDQWNSNQRNHNRRNRGAFSPGPFDDSPVDAFNGNTICLPGSYCESRDRRDEPPPEERR